MNNYIPQILNKDGLTHDLRDSLIRDPKLFAEKILKSEAVTCSITMPIQQHSDKGTNCVTTTIPFYMSNNFSVGTLTNQWNDLVDMNGGNVFTEFLNSINAIKGNSQVTMQSEAMSSKVWKGSTFDGFSVDCLFVATRRTINPTKIIRILASSALPDKLGKNDETTTQTMGAIKKFLAGDDKDKTKKGFFNNVATGLNTASDMVSGFMKWDNSDFKKNVSDTATEAGKLVEDVGMIAPLYYGLDMDHERNGGRAVAPMANTTLTLQVGEWFRATELLVRSISGITFSKEIIAPPMTDDKNFINGKGGNALYDNSPNGSDYGYPLWGKCTINLIPFSMMHKEKFNNYFIDKEYDGIMGMLKGNLQEILGQTGSRFDLPNI